MNEVEIKHFECTFDGLLATRETWENLYPGGGITSWPSREQAEAEAEAGRIGLVHTTYRPKKLEARLEVRNGDLWLVTKSNLAVVVDSRGIRSYFCECYVDKRLLEMGQPLGLMWESGAGGSYVTIPSIKAAIAKAGLDFPPKPEIT